MTRAARVASLAMLIPLASCAWKQTPVPIVSESGSVALLVGQWAGEYSSTQTGRTGSITFDLANEKDTAFCDITMTPKSTPVHIVGDLSSGFVVRPQPAEPLRVRFIRLGDNRLSGTLEPYTDPDCGCPVTTTFLGTFNGSNAIEGTFTSRSTGSEHALSSGRWNVTRQKTRASSN
jgi:hypothetical protein